MNNHKLVIYTDGGARGNPGPAAIGAVIYKDEKILKKISRCIGSTTNNQAEYQAVFAALEFAQEITAQEIELYSDSELIVCQLTGKYKIKNADLSQWYLKIKQLALSFKRVNFHVIPRENNIVADELVNQALDAQSTY
jgi:ribonuclease HI